MESTTQSHVPLVEVFHHLAQAAEDALRNARRAVAAAARRFFKQFGLLDNDSDASDSDADDANTDAERKRQNRQRKDEIEAKRVLDRASNIERELDERSPFDF